jgi:putative spermidine/putrescine transport system ATP-binding protein
VESGVPAGQVVALVRPEAVTVVAGESAEAGPLTGTVIATTFLGATSRVTVDLGDTTVMAAMATAEATELSAGQRVTLTIRPNPVLVSASSVAVSAE